ncbi:MAG: pyrroline-5-carboxylate reductase [Clostridia bacterium]
MNMKIGFIGPGKMAKAIVNGIISSKFLNSENVYIYGRSENSVSHFVDLGCTACFDLGEMHSECDIVFLCVKPQNLNEITKLILEQVSNNVLYVSVLAGVTSEKIENLLNKKLKIIRAMPNTPLLIAEGATAVSRTDNVSDEELDCVLKIFASSGEVAVIKEEQMNAIICVNGSTPALVYRFAKDIKEYASIYGVDEEISKKLFAQTLIGCAKMITQSGLDEEELIKMVTSKGGTTFEALKTLDENSFDDILKKSLTACYNRAVELGK